MRANVNLDANAYTFASTYANAKGIPLGAAISELLRLAEQAPEPPSSLLTTTKRGLLVKAKAGRTVTPLWSRRILRTTLSKPPYTYWTSTHFKLC